MFHLLATVLSQFYPFEISFTKANEFRCKMSISWSINGMSGKTNSFQDTSRNLFLNEGPYKAGSRSHTHVHWGVDRPLVRCKFESGRKCNHQLRKPSCITDHSIAISGQNLLPSPTTIFFASLSKNLTDNAYGLDAHGCIEITLCDQL